MAVLEGYSDIPIRFRGIDTRLDIIERRLNTLEAN